MLACSVEGCTRPHKAYGWCGTHYMQWRRTGAGRPTKIRVRPTCSVDDCEKPHFGQGYCQMHYTRFRKHGDPQFVTRNIGDPAANFWRKVDVRDDESCWPWRGGTDSGGYGTFNPGFGSKSAVGAHRWAYQAVVGPIPAAAELDHLCHSRDKRCRGGKDCPHRACVNPKHLEPVAPLENWSRSRAPTVANRDKTHCKHGHEFTSENTLKRKTGGRGCRACATQASAAYRARKGSA